MAAVQPENKIVVGALLVGKYRINRELGRGGMAAVYEAELVDIGKRIAIKILAAELSSSAIVVERFVREARAAASVRSPHIVEVYDSGRLEDGRPFIAMELLEGESLYDRMARVRLIDTKTTVRIIGQVAKGLTKAHAIGIVHRDLKPENIHLCRSEDGEEIVKILDFGLAKFYSPLDSDEKAARLTREGAVFGTPAYMSPEQVKGHGSVDHRADLWALGCMAFECLTGRPVWNTDQGVAMTFAAIATSPLPPPRRFRPDLPVAFDAWFQRALERDVEKRFQSAKELAEELATALDAGPIFGAGGRPSQIDVDAIASVREIPPVPSASPSPPSPAAGAASVPSVRPSGLPPAAAARTSEPIDLLSLRHSAFSATDLAATAAPERPVPMRTRRRSTFARALGWTVVLGGVAAAGSLAYLKVHPRFMQVPAAATASATSTAASVSSSETTHAPVAMPDKPRWLSLLEEGQGLLAAGDVESAARKFKDAADAGGGAVAKSLGDHLKLAYPASPSGAAPNGLCKLAALSHPRFGYTGNVGRPAVAATANGTVVAWTDDHEQPGHDHVYSVMIDAAGRPVQPPRDLTPEADYAMRPELTAIGDRVALLFWDRGGRQPGVKARWLDPDGRIGGMSVDVGAPKPGLYWPAMARADDGSGFFVVWQAHSTDREGDDLYLRRLDAELQPQGSEIRLTDYDLIKGKTVKVDQPGIAASRSNLFVAYTLERDRQFLIERMRIPLGGAELQGGGLPEKEKLGAKAPRELGETVVVSEDRIGGEHASITCTKDACFLAWHEMDKGGAQAALVDPARGTLLWRKRLAPHGGRPSVASSAEGQAAMVFYEAGRIRLAPMSRDGVGASTMFGKVAGDMPSAWIAAGRTRGQWLVSWLDVESGHTEPFVARLECRN